MLDMIRAYDSLFRIKDAVDGTLQIRIHTAVLKSQICIDEPAVLHHKVIDIAHALKAFYRTVYEGQILCVPPQILTRDEGIPDDDAVGVPESILAQKYGISDMKVFTAVKAVIACSRVISSSVHQGFPVSM